MSKTTVKSLEARIVELERRVRDLEARPQYYPVYPYPYPSPNTPIYPNSPWYNTSNGGDK